MNTVKQPIKMFFFPRVPQHECPSITHVSEHDFSSVCRQSAVTCAVHSVCKTKSTRVSTLMPKIQGQVIQQYSFSHIIRVISEYVIKDKYVAWFGLGSKIYLFRFRFVFK